MYRVHTLLMFAIRFIFIFSWTSRVRSEAHPGFAELRALGRGQLASLLTPPQLYP